MIWGYMRTKIKNHINYTVCQITICPVVGNRIREHLAECCCCTALCALPSPQSLSRANEEVQEQAEIYSTQRKIRNPYCVDSNSLITFNLYIIVWVVLHCKTPFLLSQLQSLFLFITPLKKKLIYRFESLFLFSRHSLFKENLFCLFAKKATVYADKLM